MKKALYRKRICAEKEKLTPEKVFHTPQYRDLLTSIGHEITGGKLTTLRLYDDKKFRDCRMESGRNSCRKSWKPDYVKFSDTGIKKVTA